MLSLLFAGFAIYLYPNSEFVASRSRRSYRQKTTPTPTPTPVPTPQRVGTIEQKNRNDWYVELPANSGWFDTGLRLTFPYCYDFHGSTEGFQIKTCSTNEGNISVCGDSGDNCSLKLRNPFNHDIWIRFYRYRDRH
jgi:hypothetical protein